MCVLIIIQPQTSQVNINLFIKQNNTSSYIRFLYNRSVSETDPFLLSFIQSDNERDPRTAKIMRTSLRIGVAACLILMVFWITSEIRAMNSKWMPIDESNLSPSKPKFEGSNSGEEEMVEIGDVSGLPSPGEPITSPVRHGNTEPTDASTPDSKSTKHDPTKLPEDKILVMGKLKKQNTDWVEKGLPEYVGFCIFVFFYTVIRSRDLLFLL